MSNVAWSLEELDVLRSFKERMPKPDSAGNTSPFDARVATVAGDPALDGDVSDLHQEVRLRIRQTIEVVLRDGSRKSQVLLLAGDPGTGKTHTLNKFRPQELQDEIGYIFVGGSNHWRIGEFEAQLLDWVVQALTAPSPTEDHPLLERIRAIGFRAVDHLMMDPVAWRPLLRKKSWVIRKLGWLGRRLSWFNAPTRDYLVGLADKRDPRVFTHFDEIGFGDYVCSRFLAEPSNPLHRYALRVLLAYVFPDTHDRGVSTRERVINWFRNHDDNKYFTKRLGINDQPDTSYERMEAIKLLAHLFSPAVSSKLSTEKYHCRPRVLFLTFDQSEGRNELFADDKDWMDFFAHLSELYNSLPNVVVLFTMTLALRNKLHAKMERQFRDRIIMDDKMVLPFPTESEILRLYRTRIEKWITSDAELSKQYAALENVHVPFSSDEIKQTAGNRSVRDALEFLNTAFRRKLRDEVIIGARLDYLYIRNELKTDESKGSEWEYTAATLDTVERLLDEVGATLYEFHGIRIKDRNRNKLNNVPIVSFQFEKIGGSPSVMVHLARVGSIYKDPCDQLVKQCLYDRNKERTHLLIVRPQVINWNPPAAYAKQVHKELSLVEMESTFRALLELTQKAPIYSEKPDQQRDYIDTLNGEVQKTFLGKLLRLARERLDARSDSVADVVETAKS
ncbi:MAG: ATP-binding protein [Planctomycetes bacterium]|nr:ATP-binding protein [Planctomycetota bacterium]